MKVNSNRSFGKIDPTASPLPIDAALAEGYSPEVVVYAERLKGQYYDPNNPDKYSDSFFLEYASREFSICYSYRFGVKKSGLDDVPDPRFSGYSYVEILSMVNNGYNVPKEVIAWAKANPGFTVGIDTLGDYDTIAAAVAKGNSSLLDFLNDEIKKLGEEKFFHADYDATLKAVYGDDANPDSMVVEGGVVD